MAWYQEPARATTGGAEYTFNGQKTTNSPVDEYAVDGTARITLDTSRFPSLVSVLPAIAIGVTEYLLFAGSASAAAWGYFAIVLVCVLAPLRLHKQVAVFLAFGFLAMLRLVTLGMPVFGGTTLQWLVFIYLPFIPAVYIGGYGLPEIAISVRYKITAATLPFGIGLGVLLAELGYWLIAPDTLLSGGSLETLLIFTAIMVVCVGLGEELIFRGLVQQSLQNSIGKWPGVVIASLIFGWMHVGFGLPSAVVFGVIVGLVLGSIYAYSRSIGLVTVIHGSMNVFLFGVIPVFGSVAIHLPGL